MPIATSEQQQRQHLQHEKREREQRQHQEQYVKQQQQNEQQHHQDGEMCFEVVIQEEEEDSANSTSSTTSTPPALRTQSLVIRGLHRETDPADIMGELNEEYLIPKGEKRVESSHASRQASAQPEPGTSIEIAIGAVHGYFRARTRAQ
ncbi:dendritic arbor reduction protein 1-like [Hermetia illucens]|uniref:dendritic arbor reduction protein 1-like n=1 Tax=Hermetia illucens TaxID=343691 RepID=UPI0018CC16C5|nr:dendritic arbor reduction protein 1-like [Hermetia illucens]